MKKTSWRLVSVLTALLIFCMTAFAGQVTSGSPASEGKQPQSSSVDRISSDELIALLASHEQPLIIDVRGKDYDTSDKRIKGAMRIVPAEFKAHVEQLPRDRVIVTYCACGDDGGAIKAAQTLLESGFKRVKVLKGGWNGWVQAGGPVETK